MESPPHPATTSDPAAVLILAGGQGRRIGTPKAWLPWRGRPLLLEIIDRLGPLAPGALWVAARPDQELPPGAYHRVGDAVAGAGPLAGLAAGLAAIAASSPDARVAVSGCDYPFADPALFRALAGADGAAHLVLPRWSGHLHVLQGLWRARLGAACAAALAVGDRRVRAVVEHTKTTIVDAGDLTGVVDPDRALLNLNDPESLAHARGMEPAPG